MSSVIRGLFLISLLRSEEALMPSLQEPLGDFFDLIIASGQYRDVF